MKNTPHAAARTVIERFIEAWRSGDWRDSEKWISPGANIRSSPHGHGTGTVGFASMLAPDAMGGSFQIRTSNHSLRLGERKAVAGFYAFAIKHDLKAAMLFGATLRLDLQKDSSGTWLICGAIVSISWSKGSTTLMPHWKRVPGENGWQLGDAPPVLVSELDAPWRVPLEGLVAPDVPTQLAELYSRYSWAIDQGDIALLSDCYTEGCAGKFAPMGSYSGRHAVIGQLKSFRRHWPWMQHFADVVRTELVDETRARLIVARIIPERPLDERGNAVYGAHYQLAAERGDDGQWRISWTDYRPGWFDMDTIPAFDMPAFAGEPERTALASPLHS
jgi:hypothetical protein